MKILGIIPHVMFVLGTIMMVAIVFAPLSGLSHAGELRRWCSSTAWTSSGTLCLDILVYKQRAKLDRGLQGHGCYSYQGGIAVDQGFDRDHIKAGRFHVPGLAVCMTARRRRRAAGWGWRDATGRLNRASR